MARRHLSTDAVIDGIYASILESSSIEDMQRLLCGTLDAPASTMLRIDDRLEPISWIGFEPNTTERYTDHYHRTDPWIAAGMTAPIGIGLNVERLVPRRIYLESEFYCDFMRQHGDATQLMGLIFRGDAARYSLTFLRVRGQPDFEAAQERRFARWAPHLHRAFETRERLDRQHVGIAAPDPRIGDQGYADAHVVHLLVAADLSVRWMSRDVLTTPGLALRRRPAGALRLEAFAPPTQAMLMRAVHDATERRPALSGAVRLGDDFVLVDPYPGDGLGRTPLALLHLPDHRAIEARAIVRATGLFHLTQAEAALCRRLLHGETVEAHAAALGLSPWTVRTHLRNVFGKTGTSRQAELVALLYRLAR